jgi:glyoxylase-like metal-dependent hydrolase (beta-lactamase superfamily II)
MNTILNKVIHPLAAIATLATMSQPASALNIDVFTSDAAGFHATSTVVQGEKDMVLIDAQFTLSAAHRLTAQLIESGKNLTTVFVTHAHPDHYFGLEVILRQFPRAKVVTTKEIAAQMRELGPKKLAAWKPMYGSNLTSAPLNAEVLTANRIMLEGRELRVIEMKGAEIEHTAVVYIPTEKTVIAGDLVYNGVHPWLAETDVTRRRQWLKHLDSIVALEPVKIIGGHQTPGVGMTTEAVEATRAYIQAFDQVVSATKNAEQAKAQMLTRYPDLALPVILDFSIGNAYAPAKAKHSH